MKDSPSKSQLIQLYYEKGHDALVWYAWRCALRASSMLGYMPVEYYWPKEAVRHFYSVIRVLMVLAQWKTFPTERRLAYTCISEITDATSAAYGATDVTVANSINATCAAADCAWLSDTEAACSYINYTHTAYPNEIEAATRDFQYLKTNMDWQWYELSLWSEDDSECSKPRDFKIFEKELVSTLKKLKLDFLANDLQAIWEGRKIDEHSKNYLKKLSVSIKNNPLALRRAILYGETTDQIQAVRVLLLGSGGAGKTSLAKRLKGEQEFTTYQAATMGIDYQQHQALKLHETLPELNLATNDLDLYLWDFGGQTIFHGLHSAFLHENCVYVLVVDNRHEQAPEEWLYQIRHLAGSQAKVLLVTNEYENCYARQNQTRLLREFGDLLDEDSFFYFSCLEPEPNTFKHFVEHLIQACSDSRRSIFTSTLRTQQALVQHYEHKIFLHEHYVTQLIDESETETETILNQLTQLGFLISVKSGGSQYCLKPAWAVDNAYKLLYADAIRVTHGLVSLRDLAKVLSGEIEPEHVDFLAEFLNERASCCLLPNNYYFFPDAAPPNEPAALKDLLEQQPQLAISFDVPYLPLGFHARLVHALFSRYLQSTTNIWRHGFIMQTKDTQATVQYQLRKSRVELVLTGELAGFSELLSAFLNEFKKLVSSEQIQPSVKIHKDLFSVHSTERLIRVLETIQNYDQLIEEVKAMAAKESHIHYAGDHIENKGGAGSNFATKSEKFSQNSHVQYVEVSADQRQQLTLLMDELLKAQPKGKDLVTIGTVQEALDSPNEPKSKSLLSKIWNGVKDVGVFTKETGIPIAEKVIEHKDTILSVVSAGIAAASSIT